MTCCGVPPQSLANVAEIQRGLELSKEIQRAVIEHAGRAIQARRVERYHGFCCVNLSEGLPARSRELLCFPMALTRLATFIQDAHASMGGSRAFLRMGERALQLWVASASGLLRWGAQGLSRLCSTEAMRACDPALQLHAVAPSHTPAVVVGPEEHGTGKCWVVGVTSRLLRGTAGNALSVFFQNTLDKVGAALRPPHVASGSPAAQRTPRRVAVPLSQIESAASNDAFLASTVRIPTGEVNRFIDELHDVVLAAEEDAQ